MFSKKSTVESGSRKTVVGRHQQGQSLMELIVVITVVVFVVGALTFATIASLRNAAFAQNQAQATKLAQEGIEKVRSVRDRDSLIRTDIDYSSSSPLRNINKFSELYSVELAHAICNTVAGDTPCYFRFDSGILTKVTNVDFETTGSLKRQILIGDQTSSTDTQKTVTVIVQWTDFSGPHESKLTTILRKL